MPTTTSAHQALTTFHGYTAEDAADAVRFAEELIGEGQTVTEVARVVGIPLAVAATVAAYGDRKPELATSPTFCPRCGAHDDTTTHDRCRKAADLRPMRFDVPGWAR